MKSFLSSLFVVLFVMAMGSVAKAEGTNEFPFTWGGLPSNYNGGNLKLLFSSKASWYEYWQEKSTNGGGSANKRWMFEGFEGFADIGIGVPLGYETRLDFVATTEAWHNPLPKTGTILDSGYEGWSGLVGGKVVFNWKGGYIGAGLEGRWFETDKGLSIKEQGFGMDLNPGFFLGLTSSNVSLDLRLSYLYSRVDVTFALDPIRGSSLTNAVPPAKWQWFLRASVLTEGMFYPGGAKRKLDVTQGNTLVTFDYGRYAALVSFGWANEWLEASLYAGVGQMELDRNVNDPTDSKLQIYGGLLLKVRLP